MTEDFVTYDQALALKRCGFDWPCDHSNPDCIAIPLWLAAKWLREVKGIDIEIRVWLVGNEREYRPYAMPPKSKDFIAYPPEKRYEQALSAGISAALELIEKGI